MFGLFVSHGMALTKYLLVLNGWCITEVYVWYFTFQQYFVLIPLLVYVDFAIKKLRGKL
jgi:hypothetical protein